MYKRQGDVSLSEQEEWYKKAFQAMELRPWIRGMVLWSWNSGLGPVEEAKRHRYYEIYGKPAETVVKQFFERGDR